MVAQKDISEYSDCTFEEFLSDDFFIQSNLYPTEDSDLFWKKFELENKGNPDNYSMAKKCLDELNKEILDKRSVTQIWEKIQNANQRTKSRKVFTLTYRWAAVAAIFLIIGGALLNQWMLRPSEIPAVYQEVIVPLGSQTKIVLPDGSHVNLNAGSTLRYCMDFGVKQRDLWLDGEGFFDVRKSSVPFIVHSGTVQIRAVGTSFNVRAYSSEQMVETTLVSGEIIVKGTGHRETIHEGITLLPNQKLIISNTSEIADKTTKSDEAASTVQDAVVLKKEINPASEISWKDNIWVIDREELGSLAVKLERRFDVEIVFASEQLKSFRYNGSLPDLSLEQVLKIMSIVSPVNYSIDGKKVVFSGNKK